MSHHNFSNASIQNVEDALVDQYGRTNVCHRLRNESEARWTVRISDKTQANVIGKILPDAVSVTMRPSTHTVVWCATAIGYLALVVPGIALTAWIIFVRFITARIIANRFPSMIEAVKRMAAAENA